MGHHGLQSSLFRTAFPTAPLKPKEGLYGPPANHIDECPDRVGHPPAKERTLPEATPGGFCSDFGTSLVTSACVNGPSFFESLGVLALVQ